MPSMAPLPFSTSQSLAFPIASLILPGRAVNHSNTEVILSTSPCNRPPIIYPPCSAMTVDGLLIPNAFLNPLISGVNTCSYIHSPILYKASFIPLRIPKITFSPHSSIFSWKYSLALVIPSPRSPPRNSANPPSAAPINSNNRSTISVHSILSKKVLRLSPTCCQFVFSIA